MICTFFGHSNFTEEIKGKLKNEIIKVIESGFSTFYVGNNGRFDCLVQQVLRELSCKYYFEYAVVVSRLGERALGDNQEKTIFPQELENSIPRFAINKRNNWLINHSDYAICYVTNKFTNSYKWFDKAKKKGLGTVNLGELSKCDDAILPVADKSM